MREHVVGNDEASRLEERSRQSEQRLVVVLLGVEEHEIEHVLGPGERLVRVALDELGPLLEPGALVVADNVLSRVESLGAYSAARQADETLSSVTVPLDRGLEVSVVLGSTA